MRTRLISLLTAGALAISSLVIGGSLAQAEDETPATGSISGKVILPEGYSFSQSSSTPVYAYEVDSSSGTPQIVGSEMVASVGGWPGCTAEMYASDGCSTYTFDDLVPGKQYLLVVYHQDDSAYPSILPSNDFLTTAYNGFSTNSGYHDVGYNALYNWDLTSAGINLVTATETPTTGIDITLVKAPIISGTLSLPTGYTLETGTVYAREVVQTEDGLSLSGSLSASTSADGEYRILANPGSTYIVWAPAHQNLSQGDASYLLTAVAGGYLTESAYLTDNGAIDLSDPTIEKVTPTGDVTVDLEMTVGAKITGTVYMPDGTPAGQDPSLGNVSCIPVSSYGQSATYISDIIADDGSYSYTVVPGRQYVVQASVQASVNGYPIGWVGGFVGSQPVLPDEHVAEITAPGSGQTKTGQDIHLVEGSSISGTLIGYEVDPDYPGLGPSAGVQACILHDDGTTSDCSSATGIDSYGNIGGLNTDGTYTITGLTPGATYVVSAWASGFVTTWYGGYMGYISNNDSILPNSKVQEITAAESGDNVPDVDITMARPVTVTGSIVPASVPSNGGAYVFACPTYVQDDQTYYRTLETVHARSMNGPQDVSTRCTYAWVAPDSDSTYSLQLIPGVDYVIVGEIYGSDDDAWFGGRVGDSGIGKIDQTMVDRLLPSSAVTLVSGKPGDTVSGVDLHFGTPVSVTFDPDGGTPTPDVATIAQGGTTALPADPTKTGYVFGGWYTQKDGAGTQFTADTVVDADVTVYAKWTPVVVPPVTYTVTFVDNIGSPTPDPMTVSSGGTVVLPPDPTSTQYSFAGWYTYVNGVRTPFTADTIVNSDMTVRAFWNGAPQAVIGYWVTYDPNGGTGMAEHVSYFGEPGQQSQVKENDFTRDGYTFSSWNTDADGSGTSYTPGEYSLTGSVTLYAQWTEMPPVVPAVYTVTFDVQGGTAVDPVTVAQGGSVSLPTAPIKDGYVFGGWYTQKDGVGTQFTADTVVDADVTVYAKWTEVVAPPVTHTVTFDPDGGTPTPDTITIAQGGTVALPADPTKTGYVFGGWFTQRDGAGTRYTADTVVTADVTVYAKWTEIVVPPLTYTVSYDPNGGTGTVTDAGSYSSGDQATVKANGFTRDGYTFSSWNTAADGSGTSYAPGGSLAVTGNVTLFAQWVAVTPPTPPTEPPSSEVERQDVVATTTGGAARIADGNDSYSLVTTLTSGAGDPMPGLADHLATVVPANVAASSFVDNTDGTYTVQITSTVPGNYLVTVTLDGDAVGDPIPVNFIDATIEEQVRAPGQSQDATGLGFLPGEQVTVTVHSDPISLGVFTADARGRVHVTFDVPADFALGRHTVEFAGAISGTVTVGFSVAAPASTVNGIQTGGTAQDNGFLLLLAAVLIASGLLIQRTRTVF